MEPKFELEFPTEEIPEEQPSRVQVVQHDRKRQRWNYIPLHSPQKTAQAKQAERPEWMSDRNLLPKRPPGR